MHENDVKASNKERRKLRRTVVREAMDWAAGKKNESGLLAACQALRSHEGQHPGEESE